MKVQFITQQFLVFNLLQFQQNAIATNVSIDENVKLCYFQTRTPPKLGLAREQQNRVLNGLVKINK